MKKDFCCLNKITGLTIMNLEKGSNFTSNVSKNTENLFWKEVLVVWHKIQ